MVVYVLCLFFQLSTVIQKDDEDDDEDDDYYDESDYKWTVTSSSGLLSVSGRLHTEQPQTLVVDIPGDVSTPALTQFFQVIPQKLQGILKLKLWKSYLEYDKCDKSLLVVLPDFE